MLKRQIKSNLQQQTMIFIPLIYFQIIILSLNLKHMKMKSEIRKGGHY
jgi:hypothetical protein